MKEKMIFSKNVSRPSNPPDELVQNVSKKKNRCRTNYSSTSSSKVQNLTVFSFIYMIRIRFFGPRELIQNGLGTAQYITNVQKRLGNRAYTGFGQCRLCGSFLASQFEHGVQNVRDI